MGRGSWWRVKSYVFLIVSLSFVSLACSQESMQAFFGPPAFKPDLSGELHWRGFETTEVEQEDQKLALQAYGFRGGYRQAVSAQYEWLISGKAMRYDVETQALIPGSGGAPIPAELWDLELSAGLKRRWEGGHAAGLVASVGSPSDRPFHSLSETQLGATAFYLRPAGGRNAWVFFLNYSNQRSFLNHVPLPGVAYLWVPSRDTFAMIGLPVALLRTSLTPDLSLELFYFPPVRGRVRLAYALTPRVMPYLRFRSDRDAFLRWDRSESDAWLRHAVVEAISAWDGA